MGRGPVSPLSSFHHVLVCKATDVSNPATGECRLGGGTHTSGMASSVVRPVRVKHGAHVHIIEALVIDETPSVKPP